MARLLSSLILALLLATSCGSAAADLKPVASGAGKESVRPELWGLLTDALAKQLSTRQNSYQPGIDGLYVECTWIHMFVDTDVFWDYYNPGDYDLNSEVNISDLVPVGTYFGFTSSYQQWTDAQLADGDANGEVNIADVTPIGVHYGNRVLQYVVEGYLDDDQTWHMLGTRDFEDAEIYGDPPIPRFNFYFHDTGIGESIYSDFRVRTVGR